MKNKLTDLNNHLFMQLERLGDELLTSEQIEHEVKRTDAIVSVSEQIINNATIALKSAELLSKNGYRDWEAALPMIEKKANPAGLPDFSDQDEKQR